MNPEIIEQIGGEFGVTVIYTLDPKYKSHIDFFATEVTGIEDSPNKGKIIYERRGAGNSMDTVYDPHEAEPFIAGSVKWDGCSHMWFGNKDGYLHLCGFEDVDKLSNTLKQIHKRCGELMVKQGVELLKDAFEEKT